MCEWFFVGICLALQLSPKALVVNTSLSCTMLGWYIFFHISMMLIHLVLDNRKPKHIHTFIVVVKHYIYFHNYQVPEGKQVSSINTQHLKLNFEKNLSKITNYLYFKDSLLLKCFLSFIIKQVSKGWSDWGNKHLKYVKFFHSAKRYNYH